jgi:hypothetical protein
MTTRLASRPYKGERITPASENKRGGMTLVQNFAITGPADKRSQDQIAAAAYQGARRAAMRMN